MGMVALIEGLEFYTSDTPKAFKCGGHMVMPFFTSSGLAAQFGQRHELPSVVVGIRPQEIGWIIVEHQGEVDFFALNPVGPNLDQVEKLNAGDLIWGLIYEAHDQGKRRGQRLAGA